MTLHEWDHQIARCLHSIESNARWITHYCDNIEKHSANLEYAMRLLRERPDFETKARDELVQSIAKLQVTLALCRSALEIYDLKPIIVSVAAE